MPEVSVIIPNFNHAGFLAERIGSILNQTFQDYELIILDDCSTDRSMEIIEQFKNHHQLRAIVGNTSNTGSPFMQWKKGVELATGNWIWIAESDDVADPQFLEKLTRVVHQNPQVAFAYSDALIRIDGHEGEMERFSTLKNNHFQSQKWASAYTNDGITELNESLKWQCTVNNVSSVLFNRVKLLPVMDSILGYRYHGDWMLYLMLSKMGDITYLPKPLNIYRNHQQNHSKAPGYLFQSKKECFQILHWLVNQNLVNEKQGLIDYFTRFYIGFGLIKEKPFEKNSLFSYYKKINKGLAYKILLKLIKNKFKSGKPA